MATGDLKNNLRKLISELKQVSYDIKLIDYDALMHGIPSAFLPIIHYTLLDYSKDLASFLAKQDYELYARTDLRFVETVYRILLQEFSYKPRLTRQQFLSLGFVERKIILLTDIVKFCREKSMIICKKKKKLVNFRNVNSKNVTKLSTSQGNPTMSSNNIPTIESEIDAQGGQNAMSNCSLEVEQSLLNSEEGDGFLDKAEGNGRSLVELPRIASAKVSNGLPLLDLGTLDWTTQSDANTIIPRPCNSLTVTPLKDVDNGMGVLVPKSRADVIEIEDIKPSGFKVVKHDDKEAQEYSTMDGRKVNDAENLVHYSGTKSLDSVGSNQCESNVPANNGRKCNCNQEIVRALQEQMKSLQNGFKELVTMNNELSARIVLLETQNKLMEKKVENMNVMSNNDDDKDLYRVVAMKEYTARQPKINRKFKNDGYDEMGIHENRGRVEYSPDKYADVESSLPEDFQPINVANMSMNEEKGMDAFFNSKQEKELGNGKKNILAAEEEKAEGKQEENPELISAEDEKEILSPLRESDFSFMEESTRATVKNLQKKLEETMNLFQMQAKIADIGE